MSKPASSLVDAEDAQSTPLPNRAARGLVEHTFLRRYRLRHVEHSSFLFGTSKKSLADQPFHSRSTETQEYKSMSTLGLPYITLSTVFKIIAAAIAAAVLLFGLIKAMIKAIKLLLQTMKKVIRVAGSLKMPDLSGDFLPDIPGLPKLPKLKLPGLPGLPSPPKLTLGKMFSLSGLDFNPIMAPLAILAALALLSKYRIFKARLWPPLSGLPGLRNGLYRLPYRGFKGVFSHLPYFDQLYNAGGRFLGIAGLPEVARNPGDQPMSSRVPTPKIEGLGAPDYNLVMTDYDYAHGVVLGKSVLVSSIILNLSMRFKQFKEMVPLMGPPTVKEMFGMESFIQKIMRLLAKGAVAGAATAGATSVFLETEAWCPWPSEAICHWPEATSLLSIPGETHLPQNEALSPLYLFPAVPGDRTRPVLKNFL